jgi:O-antigen/teichoic acid export membrane protein
MSQKVARNVFSLTLSKIIAGMLVLVGYATIFRYLGTFKTGQYQFALSYVMLFAVVVDFGIQQMVIKKVSEDNQHAKKYLGNFFAVEFFLALFIYALLLGIIFLTKPDIEVQRAIIVIGFGMFLNALTIPHTAIISAHEDMHILAAINFLDSVINVSIMLLVVFLHKGIILLASVQAIMGLMHIIAYNIFIKKYVSQPELFKFLRQLDFGLIKKMMQAALPFGMLVGFSIIYNKIDVIILSYLRGYSETGLYTAAYKFFDFMTFFPAVVSSSLYPYFSAQMSKGKLSAVSETLQKYTKYMIAFALPVAFGGAVLAQRLMLLFAGQKFFEGYIALQILVFGTAILFIYSGVNSLIISQLTRYAVIVTFANIFINTAGNFLLIPHFGFKAAAAMTVVSELIQAVFYFYFVRRKIVAFKFFGNFAKPLLASTVMAALLYFIRFKSLLITLPVGIIIYGIIIFASKFINSEDIAAIKNIILRKTPQNL